MEDNLGSLRSTVMDSRTALCLRSLCKANSGADEYQKGRKTVHEVPLSRQRVYALNIAHRLSQTWTHGKGHPLTTILMIGQLGWHTVAWARIQEYAQISSEIGPQRVAKCRATSHLHPARSTFLVQPKTTLEMMIHEQSDS